MLFDSALRSDFLFWATTKVAPDALVRFVLGTPPEVVAGATADERSRVASIIAQLQPIGARRAGLLNDARVVSTLPRYDLERISSPTLVISLVDDLFGTFVAGRYTAEHIVGARFVGYPSGGHVWVGHHKSIVTEIAAFASSAGDAIESTVDGETLATR